MTGAQLLRRGSAKQKDAARRRWLLSHQDAYRHVPGINDDVTDANRPALEALRHTMEDLELFGRSPSQTQRETLRRLVSELRGERPTGGHW